MEIEKRGVDRGDWVPLCSYHYNTGFQLSFPAGRPILAKPPLHSLSKGPLNSAGRPSPTPAQISTLPCPRDGFAARDSQQTFTAASDFQTEYVRINLKLVTTYRPTYVRRMPSEQKGASTVSVEGSKPPLALITGAAHRLGKAVALALAQHGYAIGLHYHHAQEKAWETAITLEQMGVPVLLLRADLTDPAQIDDLFTALAASPYPLRVLINSAASMPHSDLRTTAPEEWDNTLALNLRAPWLCAQHAARLMTTGSSIINITDAGAGRFWASYPIYALSKAALETLTRQLARALAPAIRVNAVAPGLILPAAELPAAEWNRLVQRLPLQQSGSPQWVAQAVLALLQNEHITGQSLAVDGGYQLL